MSADETPRKLTPTERLHDLALAAITARAAQRPSVTISRDSTGGYSYDVRVVADDPMEAWAQALALEAEAAAKYPAVTVAPQDKVSLTRNAKGETQIDVEAKGENASIRAHEIYEAHRARYPLSDGKVSHDKPQEPK